MLWDDSYCVLETRAGRTISFSLYLFTSFFPVTVQGTTVFTEMYLWKKKGKKTKKQLASKAAPPYTILAFGSWVSRFHLEIVLWPGHPIARCGNFSKSGDRRTWRDHVSVLHLILPNSVDVKHVFKNISYLTSLINHILKNFAKLGFRLSYLCCGNSRTTSLPFL